MWAPPEGMLRHTEEDMAQAGAFRAISSVEMARGLVTLQESLEYVRTDWATGSRHRMGSR